MLVSDFGNAINSKKSFFNFFNIFFDLMPTLFENKWPSELIQFGESNLPLGLLFNFLDFWSLCRDRGVLLPDTKPNVIRDLDNYHALKG